MAYLLIDDQATDHPKLAVLSDRAFRLWFHGLLFCQRYLTDGVIPAANLQALRGYSQRCLDELTQIVTPYANPLWIRQPDGSVVIHDFLNWNRSKVQVTEAKQIKKDRRELFGMPERLEQIRARDANRCRYCGKVVSWKDRRSPDGGTYDHIDPAGGNSLENVVVACRGCNSSKGKRTPEQAGMTLLSVENEKPTLAIGREQNRTKSELTTDTDTDPNPSIYPRGRSAAPLVGRRNGHVLNEGDTVPFPSALVSEFQPIVAAKSGGDGYTALLAWTHRVSDAALERMGGCPREAIGKGAFDWWRQRLAEDFGAESRPVVTSCRHGHKPPCPDDVTCTRRYMDDTRSGVAHG